MLQQLYLTFSNNFSLFTLCPEYRIWLLDWKHDHNTQLCDLTESAYMSTHLTYEHHCQGIHSSY